MAFVTIGIPTYKQPMYIEKAIESALKQTYDDLEIIVSDDSPDEETAKICQKYKHLANFRYVHNQPALGRVKNYRHLLYDLAQTPFYICLDGDDYFVDPTFIARAVNKLQQNPEQVLVFGNLVVYFEESGHKVYDQNNAALTDTMDGDWFFINFYRGFGLSHQTILYNRAAAMKIDFYRKDISGADWESFLRLVQGHKIGHLPEAVTLWRKHGFNETRLRSLEKILKNRELIYGPYEYAKQRGHFSKEELKRWRECMLTRHYVKGLMRLIFTGQEAAARELMAIIRREESAFLTLKVTRNPLILLTNVLPPAHPLWHIIFKALKMESFYYEFAALAKS